jgi:hypothetical protein
LNIESVYANLQATACRLVIGLSKSNQSAFLSALHHRQMISISSELSSQKPDVVGPIPFYFFAFGPAALPTVKLKDTDTEPRHFSSTLGPVELPEKQLYIHI